MLLGMNQWVVVVVLVLVAEQMKPFVEVDQREPVAEEVPVVLADIAHMKSFAVVEVVAVVVVQTLGEIQWMVVDP
jgi:hypothetical protein